MSKTTLFLHFTATPSFCYGIAFDLRTDSWIAILVCSLTGQIVRINTLFRCGVVAGLLEPGRGIVWRRTFRHGAVLYLTVVRVMY